jgi:hypothetical protein
VRTLDAVKSSQTRFIVDNKRSTAPVNAKTNIGNLANIQRLENNIYNQINEKRHRKKERLNIFNLNEEYMFTNPGLN